jgi:hypothetical protein
MKIFSYSLITAILLISINAISGNKWWLLMILTWPLIIITAVTALLSSRKNVIVAWSEGFKFAISSMARYLQLIVSMGVIYVFFMLGFLYLSITLLAAGDRFFNIDWFSEDWLNFIVWYNYIFIPIALYILIHSFVLTGIFIYEKNTGTIMKKKISEFKLKREVYGVESE